MPNEIGPPRGNVGGGIHLRCLIFLEGIVMAEYMVIAVDIYEDSQLLRTQLADARLALAVFSGAVNSFGLSEEQERQQARALKAIKGGRG